MNPPSTPAAGHPHAWRASLLGLWERLFWLRVAVGLGLGVFTLLVSGKHFYDEYRLNRDGVGVSAILPEVLPPPPYRPGAFYPMPVRFVHPVTRETIEIARVNVPGEALREASGGSAVGFRYLPADPRVSDFPPHETRPWGGLLIGLVVFMGSALAGLARVGAAPVPPADAAPRPDDQNLSGLGPELAPLPPPLPVGPLPDPLTGVEWDRAAPPPAYLHAGRDPPSHLPSFDSDDPVTRPFLPLDLDVDEIDPPLPAYTAMPAVGARQAGEWRVAPPEDVFPVPPKAPPVEEALAPAPTAWSIKAPAVAADDPRASQALPPVALPVFGFDTPPGPAREDV